MKIVLYKKKKNNLYEITFADKSKISLYDDIILKYNLLLKKEITKEELTKIICENSYLESYYTALNYISIKLRTEKEVIKKLNKYSKEVVKYTTNRLKQEGYLNDILYIKSYINDAINLKMVGPKKIINDLKKLGFKENDIVDYLNNFKKDIWQDKITKLINKKINSNHTLSGEHLKRKVIEDLNNKGFSKEDIYEIIDNFEFNDDGQIYEKEYNKLKNKLSKKYTGDKLEYFIKMNLLKKGFKQ